MFNSHFPSYTFTQLCLTNVASSSDVLYCAVNMEKYLNTVSKRRLLSCLSMKSLRAEKREDAHM